jgi:hypothetical protein
MKGRIAMAPILITIAKEAGKIGIKVLTTFGTEYVKNRAKPVPKQTPPPPPPSTAKKIATASGGVALSMVTAYAIERAKQAGKPSPQVEYDREYAKTKGRWDAIRDSKEGVVGCTKPKDEDDEKSNPAA